MGKNISAIKRNYFYLHRTSQVMSYYIMKEVMEEGMTYGRGGRVLWVTI